MHMLIPQYRVTRSLWEFLKMSHQPQRDTFDVKIKYLATKILQLDWPYQGQMKKKNLILNNEPGLIWLVGNASIGPSPLSLVTEPRGHNVWGIATTHPTSQVWYEARVRKVRREVLRAYGENSAHGAAIADRNSTGTPDFHWQIQGRQEMQCNSWPIRDRMLWRKLSICKAYLD